MKTLVIEIENIHTGKIESSNEHIMLPESDLDGSEFKKIRRNQLMKSFSFSDYKLSRLYYKK